MEFETDSIDYSVPEFFERFSGSFPIFAMVTQGYHGDILEDTFDIDQIIRIETFSSQKRVVVEREGGGARGGASFAYYSFPLDYPVKFCVSKHGDKETTLHEIIDECKLPVSVQFAKNQYVNVANRTVSTKHFPPLTLTDTFEEVYMLGNFIDEGTLTPDHVAVPLYLSETRLSEVTGIKDDSKPSWNRYKARVKRQVDSEVTFDRSYGNPDIAVYKPEHIKSNCIYANIAPVVYVNLDDFDSSQTELKSAVSKTTAEGGNTWSKHALNMVKKARGKIRDVVKTKVHSPSSDNNPPARPPKPANLSATLSQQDPVVISEDNPSSTDNTSLIYDVVSPPPTLFGTLASQSNVHQDTARELRETVGLGRKKTQSKAGGKTDSFSDEDYTADGYVIPNPPHQSFLTKQKLKFPNSPRLADNQTMVPEDTTDYEEVEQRSTAQKSKPNFQVHSTQQSLRNGNNAPIYENLVLSTPPAVSSSIGRQDTYENATFPSNTNMSAEVGESAVEYENQNSIKASTCQSTTASKGDTPQPSHKVEPQGPPNVKSGDNTTSIHSEIQAKLKEMTRKREQKRKQEGSVTAPSPVEQNMSDNQDYTNLNTLKKNAGIPFVKLNQIPKKETPSPQSKQPQDTAKNVAEAPPVENKPKVAVKPKLKTPKPNSIPEEKETPVKQTKPTKDTVVIAPKPQVEPKPDNAVPVSIRPKSPKPQPIPEGHATVVDVSALDIDAVADWLKKLNLEKYAPMLREEMVDGNILREMSKDDFKKDFGMTNVESIRLSKFAKDGYVPR